MLTMGSLRFSSVVKARKQSDRLKSLSSPVSSDTIAGSTDNISLDREECSDCCCEGWGSIACGGVVPHRGEGERAATLDWEDTDFRPFGRPLPGFTVVGTGTSASVSIHTVLVVGTILFIFLLFWVWGAVASLPQPTSASPLRLLRLARRCMARMGAARWRLRLRSRKPSSFTLTCPQLRQVRQESREPWNTYQYKVHTVKVDYIRYYM